MGEFPYLEDKCYTKQIKWIPRGEQVGKFKWIHSTGEQVGNVRWIPEREQVGKWIPKGEQVGKVKWISKGEQVGKAKVKWIPR